MRAWWMVLAACLAVRASAQLGCGLCPGCAAPYEDSPPLACCNSSSIRACASLPCCEGSEGDDFIDVEDRLPTTVQMCIATPQCATSERSSCCEDYMGTCCSISRSGGVDPCCEATSSFYAWRADKSYAGGGNTTVRLQVRKTDFLSLLPPLGVVDDLVIQVPKGWNVTSASGCYISRMTSDHMVDSSVFLPCGVFVGDAMPVGLSASRLMAARTASTSTNAGGPARNTLKDSSATAQNVSRGPQFDGKPRRVSAFLATGNDPSTDPSLAYFLYISGLTDIVASAASTTSWVIFLTDVVVPPAATEPSQTRMWLVNEETVAGVNLAVAGVPPAVAYDAYFGVNSTVAGTLTEGFLEFLAASSLLNTTLRLNFTQTDWKITSENKVHLSYLRVWRQTGSSHPINETLTAADLTLEDDDFFFLSPVASTLQSSKHFGLRGAFGTASSSEPPSSSSSFSSSSSSTVASVVFQEHAPQRQAETLAADADSSSGSESELNAVFPSCDVLSGHYYCDIAIGELMRTIEGAEAFFSSELYVGDTLYAVGLLFDAVSTLDEASLPGQWMLSVLRGSDLVVGASVVTTSVVYEPSPVQKEPSHFSVVSIVIYTACLTICIYVTYLHGLDFTLDSLWADLTAICAVLSLALLTLNNALWIIHPAVTYYYVDVVVGCVVWTMLLCVCFDWAATLTRPWKQFSWEARFSLFLILNFLSWAFMILSAVFTRDVTSQVYENELTCLPGHCGDGYLDQAFSDIQPQEWREYDTSNIVYINKVILYLLFALITAVIMLLGCWVMKQRKFLLSTSAGLDEIRIKRGLRLYQMLLFMVTLCYLIAWVLHLTLQTKHINYAWWYVWAIWLPNAVPPCCFLFLLWNSETGQLRVRNSSLDQTTSTGLYKYSEFQTPTLDPFDLDESLDETLSQGSTPQQEDDADKDYLQSGHRDNSAQAGQRAAAGRSEVQYSFSISLLLPFQPLSGCYVVVSVRERSNPNVPVPVLRPTMANETSVHLSEASVNGRSYATAPLANPQFRRSATMADTQALPSPPVPPAPNAAPDATGTPAGAADRDRLPPEPAGMGAVGAATGTAVTGLSTAAELRELVGRQESGRAWAQDREREFWATVPIPPAPLHLPAAPLLMTMSAAALHGAEREAGAGLGHSVGEPPSPLPSSASASFSAAPYEAAAVSEAGAQAGTHLRPPPPMSLGESAVAAGSMTRLGGAKAGEEDAEGPITSESTSTSASASTSISASLSWSSPGASVPPASLPLWKVVGATENSTTFDLQTVAGFTMADKDRVRRVRGRLSSWKPHRRSSVGKVSTTGGPAPPTSSSSSSASFSFSASSSAPSSTRASASAYPSFPPVSSSVPPAASVSAAASPPATAPSASASSSGGAAVSCSATLRQSFSLSPTPSAPTQTDGVAALMDMSPPPFHTSRSFSGPASSPLSPAIYSPSSPGAQPWFAYKFSAVLDVFRPDTSEFDLEFSVYETVATRDGSEFSAVDSVDSASPPKQRAGVAGPPPGLVVAKGSRMGRSRGVFRRRLGRDKQRSSKSASSTPAAAGAGASSTSSPSSAAAVGGGGGGRGGDSASASAPPAAPSEDASSSVSSRAFGLRRRRRAEAKTPILEVEGESESTESEAERKRTTQQAVRGSLSRFNPLKPLRDKDKAKDKDRVDDDGGKGFSVHSDGDKHIREEERRRLLSEMASTSGWEREAQEHGEVRGGQEEATQEHDDDEPMADWEYFAAEELMDRLSVDSELQLPGGVAREALELVSAAGSVVDPSSLAKAAEALDDSSLKEEEELQPQAEARLLCAFFGTSTQLKDMSESKKRLVLRATHVDLSAFLERQGGLRAQSEGAEHRKDAEPPSFSQLSGQNLISRGSGKSGLQSSSVPSQSRPSSTIGSSEDPAGRGVDAESLMKDESGTSASVLNVNAPYLSVNTAMVVNRLVDTEAKVHTVSKQYAYETAEGARFVVVEDLTESVFSNDITIQVLEILLRERTKQYLQARQDLRMFDQYQRQRIARETVGGVYETLIDQIQDHGDMNIHRRWLEQRVQRRAKYVKELRSARAVAIKREDRRILFKPSTEKKNPKMMFLPVNLHLQEMWVGSESPVQTGAEDLRSTALYETVTVGAMAAHVYKFKNGGLLHLLQLRNRLPALPPSSVSAEKAGRPGNVEPLMISEASREADWLEWEIQLRKDVCLTQALAALVTSFTRKVDLALQASERKFGLAILRQLSTLGFLIEVESLLSTHGKEVGMLEDMASAIAMLASVRFILVDASVAPGYGRQRSRPTGGKGASFYPHAPRSHHSGGSSSEEGLEGQRSGASRSGDYVEGGRRVALSDDGRVSVPSILSGQAVINRVTRGYSRKGSSARDFWFNHGALYREGDQQEAGDMGDDVQSMPSADQEWTISDVSMSRTSSTRPHSDGSRPFSETSPQAKRQDLDEHHQKRPGLLGERDADEEIGIEPGVIGVKVFASAEDYYSASGGGRRRPTSDQEGVDSDGHSYVIAVYVRTKEIPLIPSLLAGGFVSVYPLLFTQGINEMQTIANNTMSRRIEIQEILNSTNFRNLTRYVNLFQHFVAKDENAILLSRNIDIKALLKDLDEAIKGAGSKKVKVKRAEILQISADICREIQGGRVTVCKSAKDRTSMSVTLEQGRILKRHHGLPEGLLSQTVSAMRSNGVRLENAYKNTGRHLFAFNALQRKMLPEEYRCPPQTGGQNMS